MQTSQLFTATLQLSCRLFFQGHPLAYLQDCGNAVKTGAILLGVKGTQLRDWARRVCAVGISCQGAEEES